jgi:hypothetical protein
MRISIIVGTIFTTHIHYPLHYRIVGALIVGVTAIYASYMSVYDVVTVCLNPIPQFSGDTSPAHVPGIGPRFVTHIFTSNYTCVNAGHKMRAAWIGPFGATRLGLVYVTWPGLPRIYLKPRASITISIYIYIYGRYNGRRDSDICHQQEIGL